MTDSSLLDTVRRTLTATVDADEERARREPPYPTPAPWRDLEAALAAVVQAAPAGLADRPTVHGILAAPERFPDRARLAASAPFDVGGAVVLLVAADALGEADIDALTGEGLGAGGSVAQWRRQLVLNALAADDVEAATRAAEAIGERAFMGHRDIGGFHADRGDLPAFSASWPQYRAGTERVGMERLRHRLVRGVATHGGWAAAVAVAGDPRFGPRYAAGAFGPWAATGDVRGLLAVFDGEAWGVLTALDELGVLVDALVAAAPGSSDTDTDVDGLAEVFARLRAVDPAADKATMRQRDLLLSRLWPAIGDPATLKAVRSTIRTPQVRGELTRLARDVR